MMFDFYVLFEKPTAKSCPTASLSRTSLESFLTFIASELKCHGKINCLKHHNALSNLCFDPKSNQFYVSLKEGSK